MAEDNGHNLNTSFFLIVGFILGIGLICVLFWVPNLLQADGNGATSISLSEQFHQGQLIRLTPTPAPEVEDETAHTETSESNTGATAEEPQPATGEPDMDAVIAAVDKGGCVACHVIPGVPNAVGQVGPDLTTIGLNAATRIEGYTAEQYIHESLAQPNAFTAPECPFGACPPGAMPQLQLNDTEIETLVTYLLTLGKE